MSRPVHLINRQMLSTLCEKDPDRVTWTKDRERVTCAPCQTADAEARGKLR